MRISDWSSDVCSSDLGGPATSLAPKRCAQMLELAWAKQQYSRYNMAGGIYPAQFSRISSHLRNQGHLNRNYRSEEHTSELQSLMRISYAVFCLKKKKTK